MVASLLPVLLEALVGYLGQLGRGLQGYSQEREREREEERLWGFSEVGSRAGETYTLYYFKGVFRLNLHEDSRTRDP
jgi:hypothetical protein